jgi:beta-galactosidase
MAAPAGQDAANNIYIDASAIPGPPESLPFEAGGRSPTGDTLGINRRYLTFNGKPWFPVMGEFHYSRYPANEWEEELLKMKAGGIRIVSTYIFWIYHEEVEGQFDWSGQRDLRRFVELAARHGLYVWVRVGPWAHGEVRNGGLPDWLLAKTKVRRNDPGYLRYVARFYGEIGRQLKGLYWRDGGPIIGAQIENEYHSHGPGQGEEHILTLRDAAREAGIYTPFYTVTGWDNADVPSRDVVPVFGGYPDGFWYRQMAELAPSPHYFFTPIRCEENVGMDLKSAHPQIDARFAGLPFLTAEMGGGMELAYHRRPVMSAADIAAVDIAKLGSGVTLYGYYMFHGGTNPEGKLTTLQESQATDYPNDLPVKSYDYQAPLGEFGQMRDSFRDLKTFHLFLNDFGADLAPMTARFSAEQPVSREDTATPRAAMRSNGERGFLFIENYQKGPALPQRKSFQAHIKLAGGELSVPRQPVDVPSGAYTFWPVNLPIAGATLAYATAQPVSRLPGQHLYVFFAWPGIAPQFAFQQTPGVTMEAPGGRIRSEDGVVYIDGIPPSGAVAIHIGGSSGQSADIVVLPRERARNLWKATIAGTERLVISDADIWFTKDHMELRSIDPSRLAFAVFPGLTRPVDGFHAAGRDGIFERYTAAAEPIHLNTTVRQLAEAGATPLPRMGKEVAIAPVDADFSHAARWSIHVDSSAAANHTMLRIAYEGDVARIYAGGKLLTDDFYHGAPLELGLWRVPPDALKQGLELQVLALRKDAPIYLPPSVRPTFPTSGVVARLKAVEAIPEYHVSW